MQADGVGLRHRIEGDRLIVSLVGELDVAAADGLQAAVAKLCRRNTLHLVLDIRELSFIDSSGMRSILGILDTCEQRGCRVSMTRAQRPVQRLFEIVGLMNRLPFIDSGEPEHPRRDDDAAAGGDGSCPARREAGGSQ